MKITSFALVVATILAFATLTIYAQDYVLPNSPLKSLSSVEQLSIQSVHTGTDGSTYYQPIISPDTLADDSDGSTTSQQADVPEFTNSVVVQFALGTTQFDLLLFKATPIITTQTALVVNGVQKSITTDGEYESSAAGTKSSIYTYNAHFISSQGLQSFATFTLSVKEVIDADNEQTTFNIQVNGVIMNGYDVYQLDDIGMHSFAVNTDLSMTTSMLREQQYLAESYDTDNPDNSSYNQTQHQAAVDNVIQLQDDVVALQQEKNRLSQLNQTTSGSLLAYKLSDVASPPKMCSEIYPTRSVGTPMGTLQFDEDGDEMTQYDSNDDDDGDGDGDVAYHDDHQHSHDHGEDHDHSFPIVFDFRSQRQFILPRAASSSSSSSSSQQNASNQSANEADISQSTTTSSSSQGSTTTNQVDLIEPTIISNRQQTYFSSSAQSTNTMNTFQRQSDTNDKTDKNASYTVSPDDLDVADLLSSPLEQHPLLTRWTQCHSRSNLATGFKVNLLVSRGASVILTGDNNPEESTVLAKLQALVAQINGPLMTQVGFYIIPSYISIQTTRSSSSPESQWNFGHPSDDNTNCPSDAATIIPTLKSIRSSTANSPSVLPAAAITHLLIGCYSSGTIGQAYVGAARDTEFSVGWTSVRSSGPSYVTFLHEILHSFGGAHPWGTDASKAGTFGGVMDYGTPEGVLKSGDYKGSVGLNIDIDYTRLCTNTLGDATFFAENTTRADSFSLKDTIVFNQYAWLCSPDQIDASDTLRLAPGSAVFGKKSDGSHIVSSCDDINTFGGCSTTCGVGQRKRYPKCVDTSGGNLSIVSDDKCTSTIVSSTTGQSSTSLPITYMTCIDTSDCSSTPQNPTNTTEPTTSVSFTWKCAATPTSFLTPSTSLSCTDSNSWSICTAECSDSGSQTRQFKCASSQNEWVDSSFCLKTLSAPATSKTCSNYLNCKLSWVCADSSITYAAATENNTGACDSYAFFDKTNPKQATTPSILSKKICDTTCGVTSTTRAVICKQNSEFLEESRCISIAGSKPSTSYSCTGANCSYNYLCSSPNVSPSDFGAFQKCGDGYPNTKWSTCVASSDTSPSTTTSGTQTRQVVCFKGDGTASQDAFCNGLDVPVSQRDCTVGAPGGDPGTNEPDTDGTDGTDGQIDPNNPNNSNNNNGGGTAQKPEEPSSAPTFTFSIVAILAVVASFINYFN